MNNKIKKYVVGLLTLALSIINLNPLVVVGNEDSKARRAQTSQEVYDQTKCFKKPDYYVEKCIEDRDQGQNGITVGEPKIYDDALLHQMLAAAEARLAALQVFDQASLVSRLGSVSGASQRISSFGMNIQGGTVPGVVTATTLPTQTTTETTAAGATSSNLMTVSGLGTESVTTTRPPFAPSPVTVPPPTTSFPSGFSVSASDILNEQARLSAEINGLRLLLAGSLSDHFIKSKQLGNERTKLKTTLSFPIAISPRKMYEDAVAIVEVEVKAIEPNSDENPVITTIIPSEKTYNVAAITDKSTSIGGGVATQIVGFSGSWFGGRKTHYLVQDQDTVALTYRPADGSKIGFRWQFRPVLGQRYVKSGLKQTFVQIAFPSGPDARSGEIGTVAVKTYWRKYDRDKGVVGELVNGSSREMYPEFDIPKYELAVAPTVLSLNEQIEDIGGGQMLMTLGGRFLPGTHVRIGATLLTEGPRFKHDYKAIRFLASTYELATKRVFLVAHDGTEKQLVFEVETDDNPESVADKNKPDEQKARMKMVLRAKDYNPQTQSTDGFESSPAMNIQSAQVTMVDEANSRLTVDVKKPDWLEKDLLVLVIGSRVFGYSDAPLQRTSVAKESNLIRLSAVVANSLLMANSELRVQTLLSSNDGVAKYALTDRQLIDQTERLVVLEQGAEIKLLLYGKGLSELKVLSPKPLKLEEIGSGSTADSLRLLSLSPAQVTSSKYMVLQKQGGQPFLITMPELTPKQPAPPKAKESVTVNEDEAVVVGEGLSDVAGITYKDKAVDFSSSSDGRSLRLTGLRALGATSSASKKTFVLKFKSDVKPKEVEFEVFDQKQEIKTLAN